MNDRHIRHFQNYTFYPSLSLVWVGQSLQHGEVVWWSVQLCSVMHTMYTHKSSIHVHVPLLWAPPCNVCVCVRMCVYVCLLIVWNYDDTLTVVSEPINLHGIVADEKLQVKQHTAKTVELICQPEVRKTNKMERSGEDTKLYQWRKTDHQSIVAVLSPETLGTRPRSGAVSPVKSIGVAPGISSWSRGALAWN